MNQFMSGSNENLNYEILYLGNYKIKNLKTK